jgi:type IX secretion system PorP/SprF family membrane protein
MKLIKFLPFLFVFFVAFNSNSQDFHFSQFYNSPLTLNPSLTGNIKQDFRVGLIHRDQWKSINSSFVTSAMFADVNFYQNPFRLDMWGLGIVAINDEIGDGLFNNQQVGVSLSGMKYLDQLKRHKISIGVQPSYVTKGLNTSNLVFDSQINSSFQVDKSIASGEQLNANRYSYFNLNAGINWDFLLNQKIRLFAGYSAANILRPEQKFLVNSQNNLTVRHTFNPGVVYTISPKWSITPNVLMVYQSKATELNAGLYGAYTFNPEKANPTSVYLGSWFRTKDAFIAMTGLKWGHYQLAFSYDMTVSKLRDVRNVESIGQRAFVGAWEVSFIYVGFLKRALPSQTTIPCKYF